MSACCCCWGWEEIFSLLLKCCHHFPALQSLSMDSAPSLPSSGIWIQVRTLDDDPEPELCMALCREQSVGQVTAAKQFQFNFWQRETEGEGRGIWQGYQGKICGQSVKVCNQTTFTMSKASQNKYILRWDLSREAKEYGDWGERPNEGLGCEEVLISDLGKDSFSRKHGMEARFQWAKTGDEEEKVEKGTVATAGQELGSDR